ncbi:MULTISPECIES: hypothetical protein [unclassified Rhizobium]|uniref:hypothetical protein n=1 Tax=unclassified Rhizobium TaxID=2613769 RepID=UPI0012E24120|nr:MULTISPECIES: hypothetical protein [unclassified Rhizobium]
MVDTETGLVAAARYSMSPESGHRFRDQDMRKKQKAKAQEANLKDSDVLEHWPIEWQKR